MRKSSERFADSLIKNEIIDSNEKSIYSYGLNMSIQIFFAVITTILLGIIIGRIPESIVLIASYFPLRSYAGGYHAKTQFKCNMVSVLVMSTVLLVIRYVTFGIPISLGISFFAGVVIFMTAPVEDCNKPLDHTEYAVYKKRTRIILTIELLILIIALIFILEIIYVPIMMSLVLTSIMLFAGLIKNSVEYNRNTYQETDDLE